MCACGCDFEVECEGKKASIHCNRPKWEDVYKWYIDGERHLRRDIAFLHGRSQQLLTSNAALVFYALKSVMNIDLFSFIADEKELKDWLYKNDVWRKADVEIHVSGKKDLVKVRKKIKWMSGIYIILGDAKNPHAHATLWDGSLKNAINGDNHIDKGGTVYFWELMTCNPTSNNPNVFSQEEFDKYIAYIRENAKKGDDRDDCINTVVKSMWILLDVDKEEIPLVEMEQMDDQMKLMQKNDYADMGDVFDFKDNSKKSNFDKNSPAKFLDKRLSDIIFSKLGSDAGYYFWGLSIMDGFHSTMVVVNNTEPRKPKFNIYDQFGSFVSMWCQCDTVEWYSGTEIDTALVTYVRGGRQLPRRGERTVPSKTITTVTPIKHNWEN